MALVCRNERNRKDPMQRAKLIRFLAMIAASATLAGCTTGGGNRPGGALLSTGNNRSDVYIAALQGGIVSRSGVKLGSGDRERALEAEYRALEAAPGGQPVIWEGRSAKGQVVAAAPYQVGAQNCRQYTHKLSIDGREIESRGAACRNANGTWTPLT